MGLITAIIISDSSSRTKCNIGYAVSRNYHHKGDASNSLIGFIRTHREFGIKSACLDIGVDNGASEAIAPKRGNELCDRCAFFDHELPEVESRRYWYNSIHSQDARILFFQKASIAYRNKYYETAIRPYWETLEIPTAKRSYLTDAHLYSHLSMAYSSMGDCRQAYVHLKRQYVLVYLMQVFKRKLRGKS